MNTQKSSASIRALKLQFFRLIMLYTSRKLNNELILLNFYSVIDLSLLYISIVIIIFATESRSPPSRSPVTPHGFPPIL